MNELEQQTRARLNRNTFMVHNFIEMEHVEPDRAVFRLDVRPESLNAYGMVHGGAIYTLADNASGAVAHTDGRTYVTQTSALHLLRNQTSGTIRANAYLRHRGPVHLPGVPVDIVGRGRKASGHGRVYLLLRG